jgi:hypothetical protein
MFKTTINSTVKGLIATGIALGLASSSFIGAQASQAPSQSAGKSYSSVTIHTSAVSLANAKRAAQNYLKLMGFSRKGLIDQLLFEGYSKSDATKAVDSLKVNWNTQAVKVAKNYVKLMPFSRQGLIDQLMFDGFSSSQAAAGAKGAGY